MKMNKEHKNLIRRYLLWAYKTTKESFERIERKTTQLIVDERILKSLKKSSAASKADKTYKALLSDFDQYIASKAADEIKQKYTGADKKTLHPQYLFLKNRLAAIEEAIVYFLGAKEFEKIEALFEAEFTERILKAREH